MNLYESEISVLTATPGTAKSTESRMDAVENPSEGKHAWWQRALCSEAGQKVLNKLHVPATADGTLPEEWHVHPLVEPNDPRSEAALSVTALALRAALHACAGVMFLERCGARLGRQSHRPELHLCAIDAEGTRAALMAIC